MGKDNTEEKAAARQAPSSSIVHEAIVREGVEELARTSGALFWSALAAGGSLGFSLVGQALLRAFLPQAVWTPLIASFGYSIGFLLVILGRQQLFTENTLTPILPLLDRDADTSLAAVLRLWGLVLVGNLLGAAAFASVVAHTHVLTPEVRRAALEVGRKTIEPGFAIILVRGVVAGWLIALLVWLLPAAETAHVWVIIIITWLISAGAFSHVIAGSVDTFALAAAGEQSWGRVLSHFTLPALIGNILGGVTLVACINHAQVKSGKN